MPASVPTTRPPSGYVWATWDQPSADPPWTWETISVWRPGWREPRTIIPRLRPSGSVTGLMWRPNGRRLAASEIIARLADQLRR